MFKVSDPLALLAIESGQIGNPARQEGAAGSSRLDVPQRSVDIGEAVPIAFGLRRTIDDVAVGGILISPGATECRFENDSENAVTAYYHLVLSEGRLDDIPVADVFQRACRVGEHTQTYDRRAGTWLPGNFLTQQGGEPIPEATYICGSIGLYPDMTTASFKVTVPPSFDQWNRQVHFFIRGGMHVNRLLDETEGPSDNFCDLILWMLRNGRRVPEPLIDVEQLAASALFLEANGLTCNAYIIEAQNYSDLLAKWAPYFLLVPSNRGGKKGLRPILPTNEDGTIKTNPVAIEYTFTEDLILPGSFSIEYTNYAHRQPFVAQMTWRQELGDEAPIIRTLQVAAPNASEAGPFESYDLSEFCTTENHAAKIGAYIVADRTLVSHVIRFAPRPEKHQTLLKVGSIIRVVLTRQSSNSQPSRHDYLYQVERISKTFAGDTQYECKHFPVDHQRRSLVALAVANAEGTGILLSTPKTGVTCDTNAFDDFTIPIEEFIIPGFDVPGLGVDTTGFDLDNDFAFRVEDGNFVLVDDFLDTDFGTSPAVDLGEIGSIGDVGSIGGGGSIGDEGLGEEEENETDVADATPLGELVPVEGAAPSGPFETPENLCENYLATVTMGKFFDKELGFSGEGNIDESSLVTKPPVQRLTPGGNFVPLWTEEEQEEFDFFNITVFCDDGEVQAADPIIPGEDRIGFTTIEGRNNFAIEGPINVNWGGRQKRLFFNVNTFKCEETVSFPVTGSTTVQGPITGIQQILGGSVVVPCEQFTTFRFELQTATGVVAVASFVNTAGTIGFEGIITFSNPADLPDP